MPKIEKDAKIPCPDIASLQVEFESLADILDLGEREDTWEKLERALIRFAGVTRGGGYKHLPLYVEALGRGTTGKGRIAVGQQIVACMLSDRGRLSGTATDLLQTFAPRLAPNFAPLVPIYLPPLIQLLGRPNKVVLKRTEKCLSTIITHCHISGILLEIKKGLYDEAPTCRRGCATAIEIALAEWAVDEGVWSEKTLRGLEEGVKRMATDKDAEVRQTGRRVWARYQLLWPERVDAFSAPLTPTIRRYLDIAPSGAAAKPKPRVKNPAKVPLPPSRPLSVASSSSSSAWVEPARQKQTTRPVPTLHKAKSMRALPVVFAASISRPLESPPTLSPVKHRDPHPSHAQEPRHVSTRPEPVLLSRSVSTYDTFSSYRPAHTLSKSQVRAQISPPKTRPTPYTRPVMPKSASTLSLPTRREPPMPVSVPSPPVQPKPKPMPTAEVQDRPHPYEPRVFLSTTTGGYADSVAAAVHRRAYVGIGTATSSSVSYKTRELAAALDLPSSKDYSDSVETPINPLVSPDAPSQKQMTPVQPVPPITEPLVEASLSPKVSFESPRLPSPFLSGSGGTGSTGSSVKNRIAMFEQRSQASASRSPSPTPTISRVVSQSKPRSSSPLARLTGASTTDHTPDVSRSESPLVRLHAIDNTPRPQSSSEPKDSGADDTFRVEVKGVSAEDLGELAEIFSALPSTEDAHHGPTEQDSIDGPPATDDQCGGGLQVGQPRSHKVEEVVQTAADTVDRPQAVETVSVIDEPVETPSAPDTQHISVALMENVDVTESAHLGDSSTLIEPPLRASSSHSILAAEAPPAVTDVPPPKTSRAALPHRTAAPRPPLGRADRRPFKPTSHAQPTAASLARIASTPTGSSKTKDHVRTASNTSTTKQDARTASASSTRPPFPKTTPATISSKSVERKFSQKPIASTSSTLPLSKPPLIPSSASVRSFSASTIASELRSAVPSDTGSTFGARSEVGQGQRTKSSVPPIPSTSGISSVSTVPPVPRKILTGSLPPVRKDKIKRKAPLPSFVPIRGARPPLASSTLTTAHPPRAKSQTGIHSTKSQAGSTVTAKVKTVVARVKPETIPLPQSPAENGSLPHLVPLPRSPTLQTHDATTAGTGSGSQLGLGSGSKSQMTPLRKALSGTPIKARVSPALMAESSVQTGTGNGTGRVGMDQRATGSPIDLWRRSIPPSPVQVWQETLPLPASPLAVRRGYVPPSPLSIQHGHLEPMADGSPISRTSMLAGMDMLGSPSSPLRPRTKSSTSPSPLAVHSVSVHGPVSPTPAHHHEYESRSGDVQSSTSSSGEVDSLPDKHLVPVDDDVPSPFLRNATDTGIPQTKLRLSLESTPSRLRLPPTSPSPLAMATLARMSAEQLIAISPTISRSRPSIFRAGLPLPANPDEYPSTSTGTKVSATLALPAFDDKEELLLDEDDELLGVQFNSHPSRSRAGGAGSAKLRPKVKNQLVVIHDQLVVDHDLLEFSSSSRSQSKTPKSDRSVRQERAQSRVENRAQSKSDNSIMTPIHGQRTDVLYSPEKSVDLLSKIVDGSPIKKTPGSTRSRRTALWERDENLESE